MARRVSPANPRRKAIYEFIVDYKQDHDGNSPTVREIGEMLGIESTSMVVYYLRQLEELDLILVGSARSRAIQVVGGQWLPPEVE